MQIGILTFHRANNYGAVLQAYGLKKCCEEMGYEVNIIDYRPKYIENQYRYFSIVPTIKKNLLNIYNLYGNINKKIKFGSFVRHQLSIVSLEEALKQDYDAILYGSDQIWNPDIAGKFDVFFFGNNGIKTKKQIAYAASIGKDKLEENKLKELSKLTLKFDAISLREQTAKHMLEGIIHKKMEVVLDPTLLNDADVWRQLEKPIKKMPANFILVYEVTKYPETMLYAKYLSDKTGVPIVEIVYSKTKIRADHLQLNNIGPQEFLTLIDKASYVVTSSFHGTAFSIIFEKRFYTILHHAYGNRMSDLLKLLKLEDRIISDNLMKNNDIDYFSVNESLGKWRQYSKKFLKNNIESIEKR